MMKHARSALHDRAKRWFAIGCLLMASCTCGLAALAATETDQEAVPGVASALRHRAPRRPPTSRLETHIKSLTAQLGLDPKQQADVRQILVSQREQVLRVWRDTSVPADDRVSVTRSIIQSSAGQIRALLTEDQKAKYGRAGEQRETRPDASKADVEDRTGARSPR